jgi:hypothetical protein
VCPSLEAGVQSGGVNIPGTIHVVRGDIVGGDKGLDEEQLVDVLDARGLLRPAELAGELSPILGDGLMDQAAAISD